LGLASAAVAHRYWPTYKTLTPQFKTYIQLSFILAGGSYKVDRDLLRYERRIQYQALLDQQRKIDAAADRGEFIGLDGTVERRF
jgi:hypothetical protein